MSRRDAPGVAVLLAPPGAAAAMPPWAIRESPARIQWRLHGARADRARFAPARGPRPCRQRNRQSVHRQCAAAALVPDPASPDAARNAGRAVRGGRMCRGGARFSRTSATIHATACWRRKRAATSLCRGLFGTSRRAARPVGCAACDCGCRALRGRGSRNLRWYARRAVRKARHGAHRWRLGTQPLAGRSAIGGPS